MIGIWVFLSLSRYTYIDKAGEDWRSKFQMEEGHSAPTLHQVPADNWISHQDCQYRAGPVNSPYSRWTGRWSGVAMQEEEQPLCQWVTQHCGCCCIFTHLCPHHNLSYMLRHLPYCTMCFGWKYSPLVDCQGLGSPKRNPKVLAETVEDHYNLHMILLPGKAYICLGTIYKAFRHLGFVNSKQL